MRILTRRNVQDGFAMLLLAVALLAHCLVKTGSLRQKTAFAMSPYFFPVILAGCAIFLGALLLLSGLRTSGEETPRGTVRLPDLMIILALSVAYDALLPHIGFLPATALYLLLSVFWLGERRIFILLPVSFVTPALLYLLFRTGLGVRLP
ncbi:MAG: tripartite tricarboxylate transporter TctB family protein [Clostridiales bacterium]|nr:tripartite tricarboxylate transporter TctB family protein [Clostridiales bacterium]